LKNKIETQQLTKKTYIKKYMPKSWHRSWDRDKLIKKLEDIHKINIKKKTNAEQEDCTKLNSQQIKYRMMKSEKINYTKGSKKLRVRKNMN
jgi:hypothetical protein